MGPIVHIHTKKSHSYQHVSHTIPILYIMYTFKCIFSTTWYTCILCWCVVKSKYLFYSNQKFKKCKEREKELWIISEKAKLHHGEQVNKSAVDRKLPNSSSHEAWPLWRWKSNTTEPTYSKHRYIRSIIPPFFCINTVGP